MTKRMRDIESVANSNGRNRVNMETKREKYAAQFTSALVGSMGINDAVACGVEMADKFLLHLEIMLEEKKDN